MSDKQELKADERVCGFCNNIVNIGYEGVTCESCGVELCMNCQQSQTDDSDDCPVCDKPIHRPTQPASKAVSDAEKYREAISPAMMKNYGCARTALKHIDDLIADNKALTRQLAEAKAENEYSAEVVGNFLEASDAKDAQIEMLRGLFEDLSFQSGCSWCEKNIPIVDKALDGAGAISVSPWVTIVPGDESTLPKDQQKEVLWFRAGFPIRWEDSEFYYESSAGYTHWVNVELPEDK